MGLLQTKIDLSIIVDVFRNKISLLFKGIFENVTNLKERRIKSFYGNITKIITIKYSYRQKNNINQIKG